MKNAETFMREAIKEAQLAASEAEVPVGAVVVVDNEIVGRGHNRVEAEKNAVLHAEILAIGDASKNVDRWRLDDAALFVTLEPCSMCAGAMILSRIKSLYFGAYDPRQGAVGSLFDLSQHPELPHSIEVFPELLAEDCQTLLKDFFKDKRGGR